MSEKHKHETKEHKSHTKNKENKKPKISMGTAFVLLVLGSLFAYSTYSFFAGGEQQQVDDVELDGLAGCIVDSDAKFYGTDWCGYCSQQKEMLGDIFTQYSNQFYVACDGAGSSECNAAGIRGYPTWIINGQEYVGMQSLETLADATNCQL
ncbi:MAG: hypothetical protein ACOCUR_01695 [Nanoarchaeota archaeon]